jgi:hypothetical protein
MPDLYLLRSLAEQGASDWESNLPDDDEPLYNEADAKPIYWDPSAGACPEIDGEGSVC